MPKVNLPVYAIVELLMRLSHLDKKIGDYKGHKLYDDHTEVKTTGGTLTFPYSLVMRQFEDPALINDMLLAETIASFKPSRA